MVRELARRQDGRGTVLSESSNRLEKQCICNIKNIVFNLSKLRITVLSYKRLAEGTSTCAPGAQRAGFLQLTARKMVGTTLATRKRGVEQRNCTACVFGGLLNKRPKTSCVFFLFLRTTNQDITSVATQCTSSIPVQCLACHDNCWLPAGSHLWSLA